MKAPRILISAAQDGALNYENAVLAAGGIPVCAYCPTCGDGFDGLLLSGGDDMDPTLFGQEDCGSRGIDPARDAAELALVRGCLSAGKPILGICRGHQVLNVALGGSLRQDIGPELCSFHSREPGALRDKTHPLRTAQGSLLRRLFGPLFTANSSHHQAVDRLGAGLRATAWSESGLVEALEHDALPLLSVQFHPERMSYARRRPDAADGAGIFTWLIDRCGG